MTHATDPARATFDEAAWRDALLRARADTLEQFRDPRTSPYAAVARHELAGAAPLIFGSAPDCDAPLADLAPRALSARVDGESFELQALDPHTQFLLVTKRAGKLVAGEPLARARIGPGARVQLGRYALRFSHQNFPAVLVLDPESPRLNDPAAALPPRWFEPAPELRIEARLERTQAPGEEREEIITSTRGQRRRALRLGTLAFPLFGETQRLAALRLLEPGADEAGFSLFFRDATSGHESYPVGRYLDPIPLEKPSAPGALSERWLLDFNTAYNPACAFSPLFNCPIPPRENRLALPVRAGERDPHPEGTAHG